MDFKPPIFLLLTLIYSTFAVILRFNLSEFGIRPTDSVSLFLYTRVRPFHGYGYLLPDGTTNVELRWKKDPTMIKYINLVINGVAVRVQRPIFPNTEYSDDEIIDIVLQPKHGEFHSDPNIQRWIPLGNVTIIQVNE